jgi:hypothetical protein
VTASSSSRSRCWKASGLPWTYALDPAQMALPKRETGTLHAGNAED